MTAEYKRQQTESAKANDGLDTTITNAGLAGATLTEFGRTISDLPYGIRGIANNLSQLSTLFITFVGKVDKSVIGINRVTTAFKMLGAQLKGPLGFILAFQAVIALLDFFSAPAKKVKEETDEIEKSFDKLTDTIIRFKDDFRIANIDGIEEGSASLAALRVEYKEFDKAVKKLEKTNNVSNKSLKQTSARFAELLEVRRNIKDLKEQEEDGGITPQRRKELAESRVALLSRQYDLQKLLFEIEEKSKGNRDLVEGSIEFYEEQIKVLRESQALATDPAAFAILEDRVKGIQKLIDDIKGIREDVEPTSALSALGLKIDPKDFEKEKTPAQLLAEDQLKAFKKVEIGAKKHTLSMEEINFRLALIDADRLDHFASATDSLAGLFGERTAAGKAFAVATATIDAYSAGNAVLKDPYFIARPYERFAAMTAIVATGLANVKNILSVDESGQTTPSGVSGQGAAQTQAPVFNVVGQSNVDQIGRSIATARQEPLRAYVVESDITNAQQLENARIQQASIG